MSLSTVEDLLLEQTRDLYDAEKQLVRALPKMAKAATSDELREAITNHLEETKNHVSRLEQVFEEMEKQAKSKPCKAMRGLVEEGSETIQEEAEDPIGDLALIAAAQRVEHYEISAYGTARTLAEHLGNDRIASLFEETENEEKAADSTLNEIAAGLLEQAGTGNEEAEEEQEKEPSNGRKPARKTPVAAGRSTSRRR